MNTQRRQFIKQSGIAATALTILPGFSFPQNLNDKGGYHDILRKLTELNDETIDELMDRQLNKSGDRWDGGITNGYEIPNAHSTYGFIVRLGNAYASEYSSYYQDQRLERPMERAAECLVRVQYEDGTIDLHSTNFHSTPDTAFIVNYLSPIYVVLKRMDRPGLKGFINNLEQFLRNTGKCLAVGGIHTPNHRWVVCSALAWIYTFFPEKKYIERLDDWLGEGIDQDPDGQFTEQSVSIYSPTCDSMFLTIARLLNRENLMDVVRRNLDMTLYYIQPGGEVLTDASNRQDSTSIGYVDKYYYAYRYFAIKDNNPVYAAVCKLIEEKLSNRIVRYISELLEDPIFERDLPPPTRIPDNYFKRFSHSGIFRIRRGNTDISIIEQNPTFMSFMKGTAVLQSIRLAAAFFGSMGQFVPHDVQLIGEKIILTKSETHGYYQPYPEDERPTDGDWHKMPRTYREMSELQTLNYKVEITEDQGKVNVDIHIEGTPYVPVSMELSFRKGGELKGVTTNPQMKEAYFLENGMGTYTHGMDKIQFGPGKSEHKWAVIRGMLPKQDGESVYLTGYTPFKYTLELS